MVSVFIISSHLMFGQGLENLLRQEKEIKILGHETNVERAIERIKAFRPEVVIIYRDDTHTNSRAIVIEILKANPAFFVYQATQWVTNELEDLIKAIKDKPLRASPPSLFNPGWPQEEQEGITHPSD
ncbi:MAG: hypothetical protein HYR94_16045 [Chloroflexi bacterium]|nr:hypothetical protein [Chloroflexota bacterium]